MPQIVEHAVRQPSRGNGFELMIRPRSGWQPLDLREIWLYRELLTFLVWRDIKIRYKQTALGALWALLQPLVAMLLFTFIFNRLAGIRSDGPPYPLFTFSGMILWTFFSNAVSASSSSLVGNQQLIAKIYFPRIFIPLGAIGALLADLGLSMGLLGALMLYYGWLPPAHCPLALVFVLGTMIAAAGVGLILSALNVRFRDIKYAVPFLMQMGIFIAPVIYPLDYLPARAQVLMALNPMAGMIAGFRYAALGGEPHWNLVAVSMLVSLGLFASGLFLFRRMETRFADLI